MGHQLVLLQPGLRTLDPIIDEVPIHLGLVEILQADEGHGYDLTFLGIYGMGTPAVRRREDDPGRELRLGPVHLMEPLSGDREERVHVGFRYLMTLGVALALNGPVLAIDRLGHEIDTGVLVAEIPPGEEIVPQDDPLDDVGILGIGEDVSPHQLLESRSQFLRIIRIGAISGKNGTQSHGHPRLRTTL